MTGHERKKKEDLFSNTIFPQMSSWVVIQNFCCKEKHLLEGGYLTKGVVYLGFNEL